MEHRHPVRPGAILRRHALHAGPALRQRPVPRLHAARHPLTGTSRPVRDGRGRRACCDEG
ncbi:hypothetical protein SBRY_90083 [Actinacidiphila bryophytorum]|uniref:Uncharacterized protein n=1 Tax=Actinacidiphila bryophytorum TaxID=1436133 RepID=A0A9W4H8C7_9ACTN|nr:hypothetical protein SBRY_90083 [Actinacidiphila bryophytorum]